MEASKTEDLIIVSQRLGKFIPYNKNKSHDNWATPKMEYDKLDAEFHFNDDPCPLNPDFKAAGVDGLAREWGTSTFVNPPYSKPRPWCDKAIEESKKGKTVVMLLKSDTSTKCFHQAIWGIAEVRFLDHRLHYNEDGPAMFPSLIAIYRPVKK